MDQIKIMISTNPLWSRMLPLSITLRKWWQPSHNPNHPRLWVSSLAFWRKKHYKIEVTCRSITCSCCPQLTRKQSLMRSTSSKNTAPRVDSIRNWSIKLFVGSQKKVSTNSKFTKLFKCRTCSVGRVFYLIPVAMEVQVTWIPPTSTWWAAHNPSHRTKSWPRIQHAMLPCTSAKSLEIQESSRYSLPISIPSSLGATVRIHLMLKRILFLPNLYNQKSNFI